MVAPSDSYPWFDPMIAVTVPVMTCATLAFRDASDRFQLATGTLLTTLAALLVLLAFEGRRAPGEKINNPMENTGDTHGLFTPSQPRRFCDIVAPTGRLARPLGYRYDVRQENRLSATRPQTAVKASVLPGCPRFGKVTRR